MHDAIISPPSSPVLMNAIGAQLTALVIDDDPALRRLMVDALTAEAIHANGVASGEDALTWAALAPAPQLVTLDLVLPRMSGLAVLRALRTDPRYEDTKIVVVTGNEGWRQRAAALAAGADRVVAKPLRLFDYVQMARELLGMEAKVEPALVEDRYFAA